MISLTNTLLLAFVLQTLTTLCHGSQQKSCGGAFTLTTVKNIQRSWATLKETVKNGEVEIPKLVFKNFFGDYPSTIQYFKRFGNNADVIMKDKRFIQHATNNVYRSLDKAIGILDQPKELEKVAAWIGQIHKPKKIAREDFSHLGSTIVKSVKQALGNKLTREDEAAWKTVIDSLMCTFANLSSN